MPHACPITRALYVPLIRRLRVGHRGRAILGARVGAWVDSISRQLAQKHPNYGESTVRLGIADGNFIVNLAEVANKTFS